MKGMTRFVRFVKLSKGSEGCRYDVSGVLKEHETKNETAGGRSRTGRRAGPPSDDFGGSP